ncbi:chromatin remodelling complex Rsc7/Swp82 subunit-domain-containing protein [Kockovaella imperatae]|uniref:Chromatin remodelling complex Rsc7/Swp82 subunit-domain-containing protein n=1 Tax=Kockovaella imperatae TaxID=4999 RepID=A0A1Y1UF16_9TREE|nr:chromatin remodelling complex Rsc7/Swp82 subunit-domain-containing protein [Kockovaella imperatae]ORX36579.1 chromatin remodelling complex Rsc7/Swp82 subunit-domain-containing protein [Kockovaella imperatae]
MSSTRPRRSAAAQVSSTSTAAAAAAESSTLSRRKSTRGLKAEPDPEPKIQDDEDEHTELEGVVDADEEEETPRAGPSRVSSRTSRAAASIQRTASTSTRSARGRSGKQVKAETPDMDDDERDDVPQTPSKRTRLKKSVGYKEIPVDADEEDEVEDDDDEGDEVEDEPEAEDHSGRRRSLRAPSTPQSKAPTHAKSPDKSLEKIGSGRGGFSVKGAASAAAKARWAKVRREKAERGDDDDDDRARRRAGGPRQSAAALETYEIGSTINLKGIDYTLGDDEVELPDNEKGDAKIDSLGRLTGGREWKVHTFNSPTRRNPDRVYGLTIDVARACGYSDSLAFLRRCPQILKLSCNAEEREMLINIGRVPGNLKNRMVTIVTMRNVYKLMGARLIKNGRWVTDDYDEEDALAKCEENGWTPHGPAHEDEIVANAVSTLQPVGRPSTSFLTSGIDASTARAVALTPFYTVGGPTTQFGGSGLDPWSDAGWGGKRTKLRSIGVSEDDWMLRTAEESRAIDKQLREYREERLKVLQGVDATTGWVYAMENRDGESSLVNAQGLSQNKGHAHANGNGHLLRPPIQGRKRSALAQEITMESDEEEDNEEQYRDGAGGEEDEDEEMNSDPSATESEQLSETGDHHVDDRVDRTPGGKIIVESQETTAGYNQKYNWGLGHWEPGIIRAVYEPHTHLPHVPSHTQPSSSLFDRLSPFPIIASRSDSAYRNFVQSSISGSAAKGLASIEHVFEASREDRLVGTLSTDPDAALELAFMRTKEEEAAKRSREVLEAERWEVERRQKRKLARAAAETDAAAAATTTTIADASINGLV